MVSKKKPYAPSRRALASITRALDELSSGGHPTLSALELGFKSGSFLSGAKSEYSPYFGDEKNGSVGREASAFLALQAGFYVGGLFAYLDDEVPVYALMSELSRHFPPVDSADAYVYRDDPYIEDLVASKGISDRQIVDQIRAIGRDASVQQLRDYREYKAAQINLSLGLSFDDRIYEKTSHVLAKAHSYSSEETSAPVKRTITRIGRNTIQDQVLMPKIHELVQNGGFSIPEAHLDSLRRRKHLLNHRGQRAWPKSIGNGLKTPHLRQS